jgi:hypothetical protein
LLRKAAGKRRKVRKGICEELVKDSRGSHQVGLALIWSTLILMYGGPDVTRAMNLSFVGHKKEENAFQQTIWQRVTKKKN